ncbi:outer membrane protein assembly factor BamE [Ehrlichia ruminantium]|nr:outer membrane protein assembly factor BamE [Ehrlichia ruminantium]
MIVRIFFMILLLLGSGCTLVNMYHGYPASEMSLWDKIKVGDSDSQVTQLIGVPCIIEDNIWYYVSYSVYKKRFFSTKEYESSMLKLTFDPQNKRVVEIKNLKINRTQVMQLLKKDTQITGINDSPLRRFGRGLLN